MLEPRIGETYEVEPERIGLCAIRDSDGKEYTYPASLFSSPMFEVGKKRKFGINRWLESDFCRKTPPKRMPSAAPILSAGGQHMIIQCVWGHNGSDRLLYACNLVGVFTRGASLEEAMRKMLDEIRHSSGTPSSKARVSPQKSPDCPSGALGGGMAHRCTRGRRTPEACNRGQHPTLPVKEPCLAAGRWPPPAPR